MDAGERKALRAGHMMCPWRLSHGENLRLIIINGALAECPWVGHAAIDAYGRAVREADKLAVSNCQESITAIESLEREDD